MQAQPRLDGESYFSGIVNMVPTVVPASLNELAGYIPDSIKRQIPQPSVPSGLPQHDVVLWSQFYSDEKLGRDWLLLGLRSGFQFWDLYSMKEILSVRCPAIRVIQAFPFKPPGLSTTKDTQAAFAMSTSEDTRDFSRNQIKLYHPESSAFVSCINFQSDVRGISTSPTVLLVRLKGEIMVFNSKLENTLRLPCYVLTPSSGIDDHVSLDFDSSTRWIAYQTQSSAPTPCIPPAPSTSDQIINLARGIASGLYQIGDVGARRVSEYFSVQLGHEEGHTEDLPTGNVLIRDIYDGSTICHFQAHQKPINLLRFDHTGTKIATASISGHHINIYFIDTQALELSSRAMHVYRFTRGLTNAIIQDVCFARDSKWVAATTNRGTTHIFAMDPSGRIASTSTHLPRKQGNPKLGHYRHRGSLGQDHKQVWPSSANSVARLKVGVVFQSSTTSNQKAQPNSRFCSKIVYSGFPEVLVFSNECVLTKFKLTPHAAEKIEENPEQLYLDVVKHQEWDMSRSLAWPDLQYQKPASNAPDVSPTSGNAELYWASNTETRSSEKWQESVWTNGQFVIHTIDLPSSFGEIPKYELATFSELKVERLQDLPAALSGRFRNNLIDVQPYEHEFHGELSFMLMYSIRGSGIRSLFSFTCALLEI
eukprot:TRINITY_DN5685_c0_g1_i13.p1 TRINITY_DN5685_c0_g1~~TRINITY_DN5685_c0_g1_i13.p1  ORF type:complete len:649 (+),score=118.94 TRINITY_DN5685_c0_g1_i13:93-2039(+)